MAIPQLPEKITCPPVEGARSPTDLLYDALGLKTQAARDFLELSLRHVILFDRKQLDYGPKNISKFSTFGVVVRMSDKFERIANLYRQGKRRRAVNESILDTFSDIHVYALIALMCEHGVWPETEKEVK